MPCFTRTILMAALLAAFSSGALAGTPAERAFTADETWTPPVGLSAITQVYVVGAGAAGGADLSGNFGKGGESAPSGGGTAGTGWGGAGGGGAGAGGGGAGQVVQQSNVAVSGNVAVSVGQPGQTAGSSGGQSCFGSTCASGGAPGGAYAEFGIVAGGQDGWGGAAGSGGSHTTSTQELGSVYIAGTTSPSKAITLVNNSGAQVAFPSIMPPTGVVVSSDLCSSQTVAAGSTCTFNVAANPTTAGDFNANLNIASGRGALVVPVHATGLPPALVLVSPSPAPVNFPAQDTAPITVTVKNDGLTNLTLGSLSASGAFSATQGTCTNGKVLAASASCNFTVSFNPTGVGSYTGNASWTLTSGGGPFNLALTGTAALKNLTVSPTSLAYGNVVVSSTSDNTVTVTNPNKWAVPITTSVTGSNFSSVSNSCSGTVAANNGTCTVTARFAPTAVTGYSATLNINY